VRVLKSGDKHENVAWRHVEGDMPGGVESERTTVDCGLWEMVNFDWVTHLVVVVVVVMVFLCCVAFTGRAGVCLLIVVLWAT
jgi:hypothetical protein